MYERSIVHLHSQQYSGIDYLLGALGSKRSEGSARCMAAWRRREEWSSAGGVVNHPLSVHVPAGWAWEEGGNLVSPPGLMLPAFLSCVGGKDGFLTFTRC